MYFHQLLNQHFLGVLALFVKKQNANIKRSLPTILLINAQGLMKTLPLPESGPFGVMKRWSWGTAESAWISVHTEGPEHCFGRYRLLTVLGHSDNRTPDSD